jgi:hypothetical protein
VFCVIWLSAFATVANWNGSRKCGNGCGKAKAVVGLGVFTWYFFSLPKTKSKRYYGENADLVILDRLLWILTSLISLYGVVYYQREGYLPGASRAPTNAQMIDPDKEAFSAAPHDDEYGPMHGQEHEMLHDAEHDEPSESHYDGYGGGGGYVPPTVHDEPTGYGAEPTGYGGAGALHDEPTGYGGAGVEPTRYGGAGGIGGHDGRAQFPSARYDNL